MKLSLKTVGRFAAFSMLPLSLIGVLAFAAVTSTPASAAPTPRPGHVTIENPPQTPEAFRTPVPAKDGPKKTTIKAKQAPKPAVKTTDRLVDCHNAARHEILSLATDANATVLFCHN